MPRRARLTLPNVPMHVIQRGNNRRVCFFADDDYAIYLACLKEYARQAGGLANRMTNLCRRCLSDEKTWSVPVKPIPFPTTYPMIRLPHVEPTNT